MPTLGRWTYTVDRDATLKAYAEAAQGGADTCECAGCRNFKIARPQIFPAGFLQLLDELGIDFRKDAEVYECGLEGEGLHIYEGWYHFVGRLEEVGDFPLVGFGPDFSISLGRGSAPRLPNFKDIEVVQLDFFSQAVPWLLNEPDPG